MTNIEKVFNYLKQQKEYVTVKKIAEDLKLSPKVVRRALDGLKKKGALEYKEEKLSGNAKRYHYKVKDGYDLPKPEVQDKPKPKVKKVVQETKTEVKSEDKKDKKILVLRVNKVQVLEVDNVSDYKKVSEEIIRQHFGSDVKYNITEGKDKVVVDIEMKFGRKG